MSAARPPDTQPLTGVGGAHHGHDYDHDPQRGPRRHAHAACGAASLAAAGYTLTRRLRVGTPATAATAAIDRSGRDIWRMPPLNLLQRPAMSAGRKIGMGALRLYLAVAMILVIIKIVQLAIRH